MNYIRRPYYYDKFKCISKECTDSCCEDWEIDIDDETLKYYMSVCGEFGDRLKKNICIPDSDEGQCAHFIQTKKERCPFLNEDNLCDIFINLGEEHLSYICTHHPRFYEWFTDGQEAGLGLCCEEAARLILSEKAPEELFETKEQINEAGEHSGHEAYVNSGYEACVNSDREADTQSKSEASEHSYNEEYDDIMIEVEKKLFDIREEIFEIIFCNISLTAGVIHPSLEVKMNKIFEKISSWQNEYDDVVFGTDFLNDETSNVTDEVTDNPDDIESVKTSWSDLFWNKEFILELTKFYRKLEINDMNWWSILGNIEKAAQVIVNSKDDFEDYYKDSMYQYDNLMFYFIFRHFMKIRYNDDVAGKIIFALISVSFIEVLDIFYWIEDRELTLNKQIDICKLYSKEIEYDEDNTDKVSEYLY